MQKALEDSTKAQAVLQDRLSTVEKMAAPDNIARTAPAPAEVDVAKSESEARLAFCENLASTTPDSDIRKAMREEAAEIRSALP